MLDPENHPLICWLGGWLILVLPAAIGMWRSRVANEVSRGTVLYRRGVVVLGLTIAVAACLGYIVAMRPFVGSPDFFHHVCFARDMLRVSALVPESVYRYAPGGYAFWRTVQWLWPRNLAALQWSVLAVLLANAGLVGLVVWWLTRVLSVAVFSCVWMLVLYSRFEGLTGIPEPLLTLPFLLGVLAWQGRPLAGLAGWKRTILLGLGLGFAVGVKQQGGLLALGAIAMMSPFVFRTTELRHEWRQLFTLPVVALFAVALVIANEGRGLVPLAWGVRQIESYQTHGSYAANVWQQVRNDESLALACFATGALWIAAIATRRGRELLTTPAGQVVSFCLIGAMAATYQFTRRGYYHYSLVALPALAIAASVTGAIVYRQFAAVSHRREGMLWLSMLIAAFPLFYTGGNPANLHVWRLTYDDSFAPQTVGSLPPEDIAAVTEEIPPGGEMLVLPPRVTSLYYMLDGQATAYPNGYYWDPQPEMLRETLADEAVRFVAEVHSLTDPGDFENWIDFECDAAMRMLPDLGFRRRLATPSMTLWSREEEVPQIDVRNINFAPSAR